MPRYTLHYNGSCQDCVRLGKWSQRLDWFRRIERTTKPSPMGIPEVGDIHVVDNRSGMIFSGAYATRLVYQNLPAVCWIGLLMQIPAVFNRIAHRKPGCNGEECMRFQ